MSLKYNPDGSLDIYPERESGLGEGGELASRAKCPFTLTMRLYAPKSDALTGK
jgi:hypothetical protein